MMDDLNRAERDRSWPKLPHGQDRPSSQAPDGPGCHLVSASIRTFGYMMVSGYLGRSSRLSAPYCSAFRLPALNRKTAGISSRPLTSDRSSPSPLARRSRSLHCLTLERRNRRRCRSGAAWHLVDERRLHRVDVCDRLRRAPLPASSERVRSLQITALPSRQNGFT